MRMIKAMSLAWLLAVLEVGCGSSSNGIKADGGGGSGGTGGTSGVGGGAGADAGGTSGSDGGDGPAEAIEFTDFVKDLIQNKTSPSTLPETLDDKMFKDSMSPNAFDGFFTQ